MDCVVNVAAFVTDTDIRNELIKATDIRNKALDLCYAIDGYKDMPRDEKHFWYDLYVKQLYKDAE